MNSRRSSLSLSCAFLIQGARIYRLPLHERGTLKATKHSSTFQIALTDLDHFVASRTPDVHTLLARVLALEDLADVQSSQATRLAELERRVFLLEQRLSFLEVDLPRARRRRTPPGRDRFPILAHRSPW